jgi:chemotaxis response regulator CheB
MPREAIQCGGIDRTVPLHDMAQAILTELYLSVPVRG